MRIPIAEVVLGSEEVAAVSEVVRSGWVSSKGIYIVDFEEKFAKYCGKRYGIATSNGTTALHLALSALGIGEGDEVIIPTFTFIATANAITYTGAVPIFVDSDLSSWCLDVKHIEKVITPRTKAIMPVHIFGHPCDMEPILDLSRKKGLYVIEDAAEAHGAEYKCKKIGGFSDISCFSFYGNKIITTGEGGMCLTDDGDLAEKMRIARDHGMSRDKKYIFDSVGFNYRMTNMQAALGVVQLGRIEYFIKRKREIACLYMEYLKDLYGKGLIKLHPEMDWAKCVFWLYSILIEEGFGIDRDKIMELLAARGIETRPLFYPIHTMKPYKNTNIFPVAQALSKKGLSLPSSVNLDEKEVRFIADTIKSFVK